MLKKIVRTLMAVITIFSFSPVFAETAPTPERFKILLGGWEYNDPLRFTMWEIKAINEEGIVEIDYKQGRGRRDVPAIATARQDEKGNLYLNINALGVIWDLQYYNIFGGMLMGRLMHGGYSFLDVKAYRSK